VSSVSRQRRIAAPAEAVWATLADFGSIARWAPPVDHSCLLTAGGDPGTMTRRVQVGATTLLERVEAWEPPTRLAYRLEGLPPVLGRVRTEWCLVPVGDGTEAIVTTTIEPGRRPPQRLVARIAARRLGRTADRLLAGLASHHEATRV
jgi:uncharacterized protein YndB with AHSA1/START domain